VALLLADGRRLAGPRVEQILTHSSRQFTTPAGAFTSVNACAAVADVMERTSCQAIDEATGSDDTSSRRREMLAHTGS
jgi:hypothetical protein